MSTLFSCGHCADGVAEKVRLGMNVLKPYPGPRDRSPGGLSFNQVGPIKIKHRGAMRFQSLALLLAIGSFLGLIIGFEAGASNYLTNSLVLIFIGGLFWFIGIRIFKS
jgi:hypothetical protein